MQGQVSKISNKFLDLYLKILPFSTLFGVVVGVLRSTLDISLVRPMLIFNSLLDVFILLSNLLIIKNRSVFLVIILLSLSYIVGYVNEIEVSRRYITDFTLPFFFFVKSYVFSVYWDKEKFQAFVKKYVKICFYGSLILLPFTYYLFFVNKATRLAIFPPLELVFSNYLMNGVVFFIVTIVMIVFYGKRAQLVGAILTFVIFTTVIKRKGIGRIILLTVAMGITFNLVVTYASDNLAVRRLIRTFEVFNGSEEIIQAKKNSAGRDEEIEVVLGLMKGVDFVLGKGMGFTYKIRSEKEAVSNLHFSPLSILSKYGFLFLIFIYGFFVKILIPKKKYVKDPSYIMAYATVWFFFIESMFSYAIFVVPLLPVMTGYLKYLLNKDA